METEHTTHFKKISRNKVKCLECSDIIESKHRHDYASCSCGACSIDGGLTYVRVLAKDFSMVERLTEYREPTYEELNQQIELYREIIEEYPSKLYSTLIEQAKRYRKTLYGM